MHSLMRNLIIFAAFILVSFIDLPTDFSFEIPKAFAGGSYGYGGPDKGGGDGGPGDGDGGGDGGPGDGDGGGDGGPGDGDGGGDGGPGDGDGGGDGGPGDGDGGGDGGPGDGDGGPGDGDGGGDGGPGDGDGGGDGGPGDGDGGGDGGPGDGDGGGDGGPGDGDGGGDGGPGDGDGGGDGGPGDGDGGGDGGPGDGAVNDPSDGPGNDHVVVSLPSLNARPVQFYCYELRFLQPEDFVCRSEVKLPGRTEQNEVEMIYDEKHKGFIGSVFDPSVKRDTNGSQLIVVKMELSRIKNSHLLYKAAIADYDENRKVYRYSSSASSRSQRVVEKLCDNSESPLLQNFNLTDSNGESVDVTVNCYIK